MYDDVSVSVCSYWIGSQNVPPIYQYRLILPFDDGRLVNISTDVEFSNIDAEFKIPIDQQQSAKINLSLPQEGYQLSGEYEYNDASSTTQVSVTKSPTDVTTSVSYMQSITPYLTLGGIGTYSNKSATVTRGFAGIYSDGENTLTTQWENQVGGLSFCARGCGGERGEVERERVCVNLHVLLVLSCRVLCVCFARCISLAETTPGYFVCRWGIAMTPTVISRATMRRKTFAAMNLHSWRGA